MKCNLRTVNSVLRTVKNLYGPYELNRPLTLPYVCVGSIAYFRYSDIHIEKLLMLWYRLHTCKESPGVKPGGEKGNPIEEKSNPIVHKVSNRPIVIYLRKQASIR